MSPTLRKSKMEGNAMQLDDEWKSYVFNSGQRQSVSSRPAGIYNNRGQSVERNPVSKTNKFKKKDEWKSPVIPWITGSWSGAGDCSVGTALVESGSLTKREWQPLRSEF